MLAIAALVSVREPACCTSFYEYVNLLEIAAIVCVYVNVLAVQAFMYT